MFETGEYVVYGRTGICQVTGVTTMRVDGSSGEKLYYVLRPGGETDIYTGGRWKAGASRNHYEGRSGEAYR